MLEREAGAGLRLTSLCVGTSEATEMSAEEEGLAEFERDKTPVDGA